MSLRAPGFTLVELMIVVAIIGVLAVVAGTAYRRYMDSGRTAEVMAMMGEFRAKEEAYRAENGSYLATTAAGETDFYPVLLASGEPKAKAVSPLPATWTALGIQPTKSQLYCGYVAVSGPGGNWLLAGAYGKNLLQGAGGVPPTTPWWYVHASCDNDGSSAINATWTTASASTSVYSDNDHK